MFEFFSLFSFACSLKVFVFAFAFTLYEQAITGAIPILQVASSLAPLVTTSTFCTSPSALCTALHTRFLLLVEPVSFTFTSKTRKDLRQVRYSFAAIG